MAIQKVNHDAPSLKSRLVGVVENDLVLFRGIPFAIVSKRWTHSNIQDSLHSPFDATDFGPRCTQHDGPVMVSGGLLDAKPGDDEFKSLNLNITVPANVLQKGNEQLKRLPVMVWIHGGAFNYGANSVGRYRPNKLCNLAIQNKKPMVLVSIQYRLGALGFASSADLAAESASTKSSMNGHTLLPPSGNYGLYDQVNALQWVQNHIEDFGGDPTNVTAFGISAGSASVHHHILSGKPLFDRAIMMSGAAPVLGPNPPEIYEKAWQDMCVALKVDSLDRESRLEKLRATDPMDILAVYTKAALGPMGDGVLLPKPDGWSLFNPQAPTRCKSVILGDTGVEGIVVDHISRTVPQERFLHHVHTVFSPTDAEAFLSHFKFSAKEVPYEQYRDACRFFFSVLMFQYSNQMIAQNFSEAGKTYLYHFEEPSIYEGVTKGFPYHGQCAIYMYQNENDVYPEDHKRIAEEMGKIWTAFASGDVPWEEYAVGEKFKRFGPGGVSRMMSASEDETRDYGYLKWLREHFEQTKTLAQGLTRGLMR